MAEDRISHKGEFTGTVLRNECRTVYPKFDLGKISRQLDRPLRLTYATIDRGGEQTARAIRCPTSIQAVQFRRGV